MNLNFTRAPRKTVQAFSLSADAIEWIRRQPSMSHAIESLILDARARERAEKKTSATTQDAPR